MLAASNDADLQALRKAFEKEGIVVHIVGDIIQRDKYAYGDSGTSYWRRRY